jgi:hypothetical protein
VEAVLGFVFVAGFVVLATIIGAGVHLFARSKGVRHTRASDALRELEPRGGRQRFSVRMLEAAVLGCVWVALSGAVLVLLPAAGRLSTVARSAAFIIAGATAVATWWAWRRGALRSPRSPPMVMDDEGTS